MKKVFLSAALALAVAGSWASYPKTAADTSGYMMVIGSATFAGFTSKAEVTVVDATGKITITEVDARNSSAKQVTQSMTGLHVAELQKLNEFKQQGWVVIQTSPQVVGGMMTTSYLLEKK